MSFVKENMQPFLYDFNKKVYSTTPSSEYKNKYQYINPKFRGLFKPNTSYNRGDVVMQSLSKKKFYILFTPGISDNVYSIEEDSLKWDEYIPLSDIQVNNFIKILLKNEETIKKYTSNKKYFDVYNVGTNVKIEQISQEYYDTTNYCDVIIAMNNLKSPIDLVLSDDILISETLIRLQKWADKFRYNSVDFEILQNKIETGIFGHYIEDMPVFNDFNSVGVYKLEEGDFFNVKYSPENKIYKVIERIPQKTKITFNPGFFPLNTNDVISFRLNSRDVTYVASGGETISDVISNGIDTLKEIIIASHFTEIKYPLDTDDTTYITLDAINDRFFIQKNNIDPNSVPDAFNITQINASFSVQDAIDNKNIMEVTSNFDEIDPGSVAEKRIKILYDMYLQYYDKIRTDNVRYLKLLKAKYLDDFKNEFYKEQK